MRDCFNCGEVTKNPKFCGRSCSVKYNNAVSPKRAKTTERRVRCIRCNSEITGSGKLYCSRDCARTFRNEQAVAAWLATGVALSFAYGGSIRTYILQEQRGFCALCPQTVEWQGKELRFILDHVDGNSEDNRRENLRLVCPNCDSQLDTYKSKNKGNGRHSRRMRYDSGQSY
jgi:hypothetical protein